MDLPNILQAAVALVQQVGRFQLEHFRAMPDSDGQNGAGDMKALRETVSFVDVESENLLRDGLLGLLGEAGFYGEESGKTGCQDLVWVVDPLDGTTNYLSGLDHFSISVALVSQGKTILGIVYKPAADETFTSIEGGGVYRNNEQLKPRDLSQSSDEALFVTGFPYRSPDVADGFFDAAKSVLTLGRGIRRSGSAALDVAYLSAGWYQGFWETDLQAYDVAAGMLMMLENGLLVTNERGEPYDMFTDRLMVAALPNVHPALLKAVAEGYAGSL